MEEILRKLQKEASGSKYKAIKESCTWALGKRAERGAGHLPAGPVRRRRRAAPGRAVMAPLRGAGRGLSLSSCDRCFFARLRELPRRIDG